MVLEHDIMKVNVTHGLFYRKTVFLDMILKVIKWQIMAYIALHDLVINYCSSHTLDYCLASELLG